jgi:hypothetical protein
MPNEIDDDQLNEDEEVEETETEETEESTEETEETTEPAGSEKRIRDLQSKADAAEARANKAEAALKAKAQGGSGDGVDPATKALMSELREASLDAVFGEYPALRDYGIDRSLIEGTTRAEMREAATSLVALIKSVETKARNKALADAGIKAEPAGSTRSKPVDYANMSEEAFLKLLNG